MSDRSRAALLCLGVVALTAALYWPAVGFEFLLYDDDVYVTQNARVAQGVSFPGLAWALHSTDAGNWHPLTWLSHMVDVEIYGMSPGGHHATNVALHLLSSALLFWVLRSGTGATLAAAFAAALFALHPLRVESVAWVAERKDVLSGLFWILTVGAYLRYGAAPSKGRYLTVALVFALGLMAKSMLVTLPVVLLLLDYWPLERLQGREALRARVLEKLPLFALAAACALITLFAQQKGGGVSSLEALPLAVRLENATVAYALYVQQSFWPSGLAVLYPHPRGGFSPGLVLGAAGFLVGVTLTVLRYARRAPYALVGWLWFLVALLPVIGLIQVGVQSRADRYTYLPQIGLAIALSWAVPAMVGPGPRRRRGLWVAAALILAVLGLQTRAYLAHWHDSEALFRRAVFATRDNAVAELNLGQAIDAPGRRDERMAHYRRALEINPHFARAHFNLGRALADRGEIEAAVHHYQLATQGSSRMPEPHNNLGVVASNRGDLDQAIRHYRRALEIDPNHWSASFNLGVALIQTREFDAAERSFRRYLRAYPEDALSRFKLASVLDEAGARADAIRLYREGLALDSGSAAAHAELASLLWAAGEEAGAIHHLRAVRKIEGVSERPNSTAASNNLAWMLATANDPELREPAEALRLALANVDDGAADPGLLDTLAAAYAANGRFTDARRAGGRALELAVQDERQRLAEKLRERLAHYENGEPYRERRSVGPSPREPSTWPE